MVSEVSSNSTTGTFTPFYGDSFSLLGPRDAPGKWRPTFATFEMSVPRSPAGARSSKIDPDSLVVGDMDTKSNFINGPTHLPMAASGAPSPGARSAAFFTVSSSLFRAATGFVSVFLDSSGDSRVPS